MRIYLWHIQLVISLFVCLTWFIGVNFFSGGICEYWRCVPMSGILLNLLMILLLMMTFSSIAYVIYEHILNKNHKGQG